VRPAKAIAGLVNVTWGRAARPGAVHVDAHRVNRMICSFRWFTAPPTVRRRRVLRQGRAARPGMLKVPWFARTGWR